MDLPEQIKTKMNIEELHISRVPKRTNVWLKDYAKDRFCGDYGLCLKHVIDTFRGMTPVGYDELQIQIDELRMEVNSLKSDASKTPTGRKMADGTVIR